MSGGGDNRYIIEFVAIGNAVKATAIDPATLKEVSVMAARNTPKKVLTDLAIKKLEYVLGKAREDGEE